MPVDVNLRPILARAYAINLRAAHIAKLTGISAPALSMAATGFKDLGYPDFKRVENCVADCELLVERVGAPLDWRDVGAVRKLIDSLNAKQFEPVVSGRETNGKGGVA